MSATTPVNSTSYFHSLESLPGQSVSTGCTNETGYLVVPWGNDQAKYFTRSNVCYLWDCFVRETEWREKRVIPYFAVCPPIVTLIKKTAFHPRDFQLLYSASIAPADVLQRSPKLPINLQDLLVFFLLGPRNSIWSRKDLKKVSPGSG
ncbi:uncharacterized protein LOC112494817 [Cephus cinctus]|uniref:Uncharacterized protein LOC112494817 n=1 Tax=Cephus cinctus TaxID=211228 RepID=A0AAJ7RMX2_CEPCN|nr:uncharacterized protein LOC112494817 [Cephus cinctus]